MVDTSKVVEVNYRIQRTKGEEPQVVHVDKLVPYYPDFDTVLTPWITMESGPRNTGTQTDDTPRVPGADTRGKGGGGEWVCDDPRHSSRHRGDTRAGKTGGGKLLIIQLTRGFPNHQGRDV